MGFPSRLTGVAVCMLIGHASAASSATIDFDDVSAGDPVTAINKDGVDVAFSSNTGLDLIASNVFDAASGENYLGVDDDLLETFLPSSGDIVTLTFDTPITSLSVNFVSTPSPPVGTYTITTSEGAAASGAVPDATLADNGEVFGVTFGSLTPFTVAELTGGDSGIHSFNIDDISFTPVPVPSSLLLLASGLAFLRGWVGRR